MFQPPTQNEINESNNRLDAALAYRVVKVDEFTSILGRGTDEEIEDARTAVLAATEVILDFMIYHSKLRRLYGKDDR